MQEPACHDCVLGILVASDICFHAWLCAQVGESIRGCDVFLVQARAVGPCEGLVLSLRAVLCMQALKGRSQAQFVCTPLGGTAVRESAGAAFLRGV
jgi:hypothetical protein